MSFLCPWFKPEPAPPEVRDMFAAAALAGLLTHRDKTYPECAAEAFFIAGYMLGERGK